MRNKLRRPLAFLLSAVMIVTMSGTPVHAVADRGQPETGLCEHHTAHTDDCGYTEETPGTPCGHEHTEDCYIEVTECVHEHTPECYPEETEDSVSDNEATPANAEEREPENCPHICDGESGCITEKLDCRHEHDSECGYTESTPGTPCTYVCEICNPQDSGEADEEPETGIIKQEQCSCLTLCTEGQINPDCPVCGAENAGLSDCKGKAEKEDTKQPEGTGICKHHQEHDDACGYQPKSEDSEGSPCTYECRICPIEDLIAALPDKVTEDNADEVRAQLDEILTLFSVLTEDEQGQIDLSRVTKLQGALDNANAPVQAAEEINISQNPQNTLTEEAGGCPGHTFTGTAQGAMIYVESGVHDVTFANLNITAAARVGVAPGATMNLTIRERNTISAGGNYAGIYVPKDATLVITNGSTGTLEVSSPADAGIGGAGTAPDNTNGDVDCGTVVINGGTITAAGGGSNSVSAGIGGSGGDDTPGNGGTVIINGGTVTATGGSESAGYYGGAGIGGSSNGESGNGGTLTINGGHVTLAPGTHNTQWGTAYGFGRGSSDPNTSAGTCELTLADASYLDSGTTLDPKGKYTINGDPTADMIVVPELVYTGEALNLDGEIYIDDSKTGTGTYFGQTFTVKASKDGWVLQELGEVVEAGEYTAVFKKGDKEISKTFTVAQSGTQFVEDGEVKTYKDGAECSNFTAAAKAERGGTVLGYYDESGLVAALLDKNNEGAVFTLLDNMERETELNIKISCTLDLNGKTIHSTGEYASALVISSGAATIRGAGTVLSEHGHGLSVGETATLEGGTFISGAADYSGVYVLVGKLIVTGEAVVIENTGGGTGLGVNSGNGATAQLSAGTCEGGAAAIEIYGGTGTLAGLLNQEGTSRVAYYKDNTTPVTEGLDGQTLPGGSYTVKACTHTGEGVCEYTHATGTTTHQQTCLACGKKWDEENCSYTNGGCACGSTLAVTLPDNLDLTYTGTAQTPEVTVMVDGTAALAVNTDYSVAYDNNINAGNTAKVTVTGTAFNGTVEKTFAIKKATLTIKASDQTITYGQSITEGTGQVTATGLCAGDSLSSITLAASTRNVPGGTIELSAAQIKNSSSADMTANYTITYQPGTLTINKAAAPAITWPAANGLTYGQKLSESTLSGGSTEYGSFAWTNPDTVPTAGTSGYSVTFRPSNSTEQNYEHIAIKTQDVNVTVAQATPTVTVEVKMSDSAKGRVADLLVTVTGAQNGAAPAGSITLTSDGLNETLTLQNGKTTHKWENLSDKEYTVTAAYSGDTNYKAANSKLTFDAAKKNQESFAISPVEAKTYGDPAFDLASTGGNGSGAVSFTSSDPSVVSINDKTATIRKAGTVTITARKAADNNYNEAVAAISVTIGKRPITLTADSFTVVKGAAMPTLTYQAAGLVNSDTFTTDPTMTTSVSDTNTLGEYAIVISGGILTNGDSYQITYVNGKLTVTDKIPVQLTIAATPDSLTGGGTVTLTISGLPAGGEATVSCSDSSINVTGSGTSWKATLPNETATYTFTANYSGDTQHSSAMATCTVSVTKRTNGGGSSGGGNGNSGGSGNGGGSSSGGGSSNGNNGVAAHFF